MCPLKRSTAKSSTKKAPSKRSSAKRPTPREANALEEYNAKRDFSLTKEPPGKALPRSGKQLAFVIQKHAASHLHFDLRLELDGVMKSWAVPKGPSVDTAVKRLAMEVEDHPIDYNTFEGTIPKGEYGGGTVMLWDRGTYEPDEVRDDESKEDAVRRGLTAGKLAFTFHGDRLHGSFALVRTRRGEERAQWLLFKHRDKFAKEGRDIVAEVTTSVTTKRTMEQIAAGKSAKGSADKQGSKARGDDTASLDETTSLDDAGTLAPMEATKGKLPVPPGEYAVEAEAIGTRVLAFVTKGTAHLIEPSSSEKAASLSLDDSPRVQAALRRLAKDRDDALVLDGILTDDGATLVIIDLLLDGEELLAEEPWIERRNRLEQTLGATASRGGARSGALQVVEWVSSDAGGIADAAKALGAHRIVAKRIDSAYESGASKAWRRLEA